MNKNNQLGTFFDRLLATITDNLILNLINLFGLWYLLNSSNMPDLIQRAFSSLVLLFIPSIVFRIFYQVWFINQSGATPGKKVWGIKVVDQESNQTLSIKMSIFRELIAKAVSSFSLALGFIWIIFNSNNQGWHDLLAGTLVIKEKNNNSIGWLFLLLMLAINGVAAWFIITSFPNFAQVISDWLMA